MSGGEPGVEEVLGRVVEKLDRAGLEYMLVGSFASSMHGEPRSTQDIDIVIAADIVALERFLRLLPEEEYYCDEDTARRAMRLRSMFNVIDMSTIWKLDFIVQKNDRHSQEAFQRRVIDTVGDTTLKVESAEDTVISKLRWAKRSGGSERQLRDVSGVVTLVGEALDRAYIEKWVEALGLSDLWEQING